MLFDWLVIGQVIAANPANSVRGPKHSVKKGKAPVLGADEARALLDGIDTSKAVGLRDRALIALMVYTFARVGAAVGMKVQDIYVQGRRTWVRLREKGESNTKCPVITVSMNTCTPTSKAHRSALRAGGFCSAQPSDERGNSPSAQ